MKKAILILLLFISFKSFGHDNLSLFKLYKFNPDWSVKSSLEPSWISLKFSYRTQSLINFTYKVEMPFSPNSFSLFSLYRTNQDRFSSDLPQYSNRFQNLENLDYAMIIRKNKFYNFSESNRFSIKP